MKTYEEFESKFSFDSTVVKLKDVLLKRNLTLFAIFDHSKNASDVGLKQPPTSVFVFGNSSVGTNLMLKDQRIGIDLPSRIIIYEKDSHVHVGFQKLDWSLKDQKSIEILEKISNVVEAITKECSGN